MNFHNLPWWLYDMSSCTTTLTYKFHISQIKTFWLLKARCRKFFYIYLIKYSYLIKYFGTHDVTFHHPLW